MQINLNRAVFFLLQKDSVNDKKLPWRVAHTTPVTQIVGSKLFWLVGGTPSFTSRGFYKFCHVLRQKEINLATKKDIKLKAAIRDCCK